VTGIVGMVGATPTVGDAMLGSGTIAAELTPRLPISVEPRGMPVRAVPPCVVGEVGVDDAAGMPAPEPHMPDMPDVSIMADVVGSADEFDGPAADGFGVAVGEEAAVAGIAIPTDMPPPSKDEVDPNIDVAEVPMVEHPAVAVEDVTSGLTPGEAISVEPRGIPVPPTGPLGTMPSGDVAESEGVGVTAACPKAGPASNPHVAAIRKCLIISSR